MIYCYLLIFFYDKELRFLFVKITKLHNLISLRPTSLRRRSLKQEGNSFIHFVYRRKDTEVHMYDLTGQFRQ